MRQFWKPTAVDLHVANVETAILIPIQRMRIPCRLHSRNGFEKDRWHLIARCCLFKTRGLAGDRKYHQERQGEEPRTCLHGPDTMKSEWEFRCQKETKLLRFGLLEARVHSMLQESHSPIMFDHDINPRHRNGECDILTFSPAVPEHFYNDQGSDT